MMKAGIDIGSNSFRMIVADVSSGIPNVLEKELVTVRLAQRIGTTGCLADETINRGLESLRWFRDILERYSVKSIRVCGTEALRVALNSDDFLVPARKIIGSPVEILDGSQEALLTLAGAQAFLDIPGPFLFVDAGGGSTECIYYVDGVKDVKSVSVGLGAVTLTEKFLHDVLPRKHEVEDMESKIREKFMVALGDIGLVGRDIVNVVGSGGTITALAALDLGLKLYDENKVHGYRLGAGAIEQLWHRLSRFSVAERNNIKGLQEGRGEIVLAGLKIYQVLLKILEAEEILVSDAGLLEGLIV